MITVIGTGVSGLVFAIMAKQRGHEVSVIEFGNNSIESSCSWRAGGMLAPYCESEIAEEIVTQLGIRSLELWPEFSNSLKTDGTIVLAPLQDNTSLERFQKFTTKWEKIEQNKLSELEPSLSQRFKFGLYYPDEGHLNPRTTLSDLYQQIKAECQVIPSESARNSKTLKSSEWIVDCRGFAAKDKLTELRGVRGDMIIVRSSEIKLNRPIRLIHPRHPIYIVPRQNNLFMIGATTIESEAETEMSVRSAGELLTQIYNLNPAFGEAELVELNSGLRPAYPDNKPKLTIRKNKIHINGLYRHGFLLAPAMAELALNYIHNGNCDNEVFDVD